MLRSNQDFFKLCLQSFKLALRIGLLQKINFFFWEIQSGFYQHAQVNQAVTQRVNFLREDTGQRSAGTASCGAGGCINQIGNGLGLGQINFVIEKCALCEFARLRHAKTLKQNVACLRVKRLGQLNAPRQQQLQDHGATMCLQLEDIFSRIRVGAWKEDGQSLVNRFALVVVEGQVMRLSCLEWLATKSFSPSLQVRP